MQSHNKDEKDAFKIDNGWTEFLTLLKRRIYTTKKGIPGETGSRIKRKKKGLDLRRTYKATIERVKRNSSQQFVENSRDPSITVYKLCSRKLAPGAVIATPKN